MPRLGRHPMKRGDGSSSPQSKSLSITTLVHIPETTGYWENSLEVLKLCLSSIRAHTDVEFDLYVFDNGSCDIVKNYLLQQLNIGKIQYLTFSNQNVRKTGGLNSLLHQADGDIVAYLDSDAYVLPGWLEKSMEIMNNFDNVGQVTAIPLARNKIDSNNIIKKLENDQNVSISRGNNLIPDQYIKAHSESIGVNFRQYIKDRLKNREDVLITKNGISAIFGSVDFQFLTSKSMINKVMPLPIDDIDNIRGDDIYIPSWEKKLNQAGCLMLSTEDYLVHHMGNQIPDFSKELPWVDLKTLKVLPEQVQKRERIEKTDNRILKSTRLRRIIKKIHLWTYKFLYEK